MRQVGLAPHPQPFRDPGERHRRFLAQAPRDSQLALIAFAMALQILRRPSQSLQLLLHNPLRLGFGRFRSLLSVMFGYPSDRSSGQAIPAGTPHPPNTSAPAQSFPPLPGLLPPPLFHIPFKLPPAGRSVLCNAHLS